VRKIRRLGLSLVLAVLMLVGLTMPAFAQNPTVTIYVSAQVVSITNSVATWNITVMGLSGIAYFSADNLEDVDYSTITNTGNIACDVEIQGTDFVAANVSYNWDLDAAAGNQTYSLYAYNVTAAGYTIEVREAVTYNYLCLDLDPDDTYDWSMLFTAPDEFHPDDDGDYKTATTTLVAS
jgi:hypothetical protein